MIVLKTKPEVLRIALYLSQTLHELFLNAGDKELADMVFRIRQTLRLKVEDMGGMHMLISKEALYAESCPRFKEKTKKED